MRKKTETTSTLRDVRLARTLSQATLAKLLGVSQQTYSKYESGVLVPPMWHQARLATILGVPISTLFGSSDEGERVPA